MKALDVMVRNVITVKPDDQVAEAVKLLAEHDISALPVVDDGNNVVGIISEADLLRRQEIGTEKHRPWWMEAVTPASTLAGAFAKSHGGRVAEVMSTDVVSAAEDTPLGEIATMLERHRIKRVPVLRGGKLVGIGQPLESDSGAGLIAGTRLRRGWRGRPQDSPRAAGQTGPGRLDRFRRAQRDRQWRDCSSVGIGRLAGGAQGAFGARRRRTGRGERRRRDDPGLLRSFRARPPPHTMRLDLGPCSFVLRTTCTG
jgi:CBS domain-containing protein